MEVLDSSYNSKCWLHVNSEFLYNNTGLLIVLHFLLIRCVWIKLHAGQKLHKGFSGDIRWQVCGSATAWLSKLSRICICPQYFVTVFCIWIWPGTKLHACRSAWFEGRLKLRQRYYRRFYEHFDRLGCCRFSSGCLQTHVARRHFCNVESCEQPQHPVVPRQHKTVHISGRLYYESISILNRRQMWDRPVCSYTEYIDKWMDEWMDG